jgi:hypothetical protein
MAKFLSPVLLHQSQQKFQPSFTRTAVVIRIADIREMDMEIHIESVEIKFQPVSLTSQKKHVECTFPIHLTMDTR